MDIELFEERYVYLEWSDKLEGKDCILATSYKNLKDFVNSGDEGRIFKVDEGTEKPFTNHLKECDFCYYDPNYKVKKAWLEGKTIQKLVLNKWEDYIELPRTSSFFYNIEWDVHEWRIKPNEVHSNYQPTEPKYYLSVNKNDYLEITISQNKTNNAIYNGTKKECERMAKIIDNVFGDCGNCKGGCVLCYCCGKLGYIIKKYSHEKYTRRMTNRELSEWLAKGNGEMKNLYSIINTHTCHCYANDAENKNVDYYILIRDFGSDEWREPLIEV